MNPLEYYKRLGIVKTENGEERIDVRGYYDQYGNPIVTEREKVEKVEKPQAFRRPEELVEVVKKKEIGREPNVIEQEKFAEKLRKKYYKQIPEEEIKKKKKKIINIEIVPRPKFKRKFDFAPEETFSDDYAYAPSVYYDYNFSPFDFLARSRTFAPRLFYDYEYAPEEFSSYSDIFSPIESYDDTFAPKYRNFKRSVYSPSTIRKDKFAPRLVRKFAFKPRLFDKLLAIFAPEAIIKQKEDLKFKPYNYQFEQTAIIDTYNPEEFTMIQKFAPKDESNFNLRIAPETDFSIKVSPTPVSFTSVDYYGILKKILR